jgi:hypothetical protein
MRTRREIGSNWPVGALAIALSLSRKGFILIRQETGLNLVDDVDDKQQRVDLVGGKPETREGELGLVGGVTITAGLTVPGYRSTQPAAHVFQIGCEADDQSYRRARTGSYHAAPG